MNGQNSFCFLSHEATSSVIGQDTPKKLTLITLTIPHWQQGIIRAKGLHCLWIENPEWAEWEPELLLMTVIRHDIVIQV